MELNSASPRKGILRSVLLQSLAVVTKGVPILAIAGITGVALSQTTEVKARIALPTLSGHFPVGRMSFDWIDESRLDPFAPLLNGSIPRRSDTIGKIDPRRGLTIASACISAFFDVQLKGAEASLIKRLPLEYRELAFGPDNN